MTVAAGEEIKQLFLEFQFAMLRAHLARAHAALGQFEEAWRSIGAMISSGTSERFHQRRRADPSAVRLSWW